MRRTPQNAELNLHLVQAQQRFGSLGDCIFHRVEALAVVIPELSIACHDGKIRAHLLTCMLAGLFGWSQIIQQFADAARAQGILAFAIDAPIFAAPHALYDRKSHGLVTFGADRGRRGIHGTETRTLFGSNIR